MLTLKGDELFFSFPEVHANANVGIDFKRTFRIPDDGREYPLPPGLSAFPVKHVDDFAGKVPPKWSERGGVMLPMYQSEALWIAFHEKPAVGRRSAYPFAIKLTTGKVSVVTGDEYKTRELVEGDYVTVPGQPWVDGYAVEKGKIRQFVATPLGSNQSVEAQVTGKDEHGGLQIEVFPMKAEIYEQRFPYVAPAASAGVYHLRGVSGQSFNLCSTKSAGDDSGYASMDAMSIYHISDAPNRNSSVYLLYEQGAEMSLGAGGLMTQEIFLDKFGFDVWDREHTSRVFVHLANSLVWRQITGHNPPHAPLTAREYERQGLPWFKHYGDGTAALKGSEKLAGVKTVAAMGMATGNQLLPENTSVQVPGVVHVPGMVKDGAW